MSMCVFENEICAAFFYLLLGESMMSSSKSFIKNLSAKQLASIFVLGAVTPAAVAAEGSTQMAALDDVYISGSKIPKKAVELTHSVTVINEQEIESQAFTDVTEILRKEVGLEFKQAGGPGQYNYLKLRGLSAKNVLMVIDGVKINKPSSGDIGHLLGQLDPKTIESVEILRGPQATLYGANNSAGVIVITTKSGRSASARVGIELGSMDWQKVHGSLRDANTVGAGELVYSLNASDTESDNVHEHEYLEDTTYQSKISYELEGLVVGLNALKIDNEFGYAELDENSARLDSKSEHWAYQTPDPEQYSETSEAVYSFFIEHRLTNKLSHKFQASRAKNTYSLVDPDNGILGTQIATVDGINGANKGDVLYISDLRWPGISTAPQDYPVNDITARYSDSTEQYNYDLLVNADAFDLIAGIESLKQIAKQRGTYGVANNDDSQISYYLNGDIKFVGGALVLATGIRHDDYDSWGEQTTGNVGVSWQISGQTAAYANVGTSFTPATMTQLYNPIYGDDTITPEEGITHELGLRQSAFSDALKLELTYWRTEIDDVVFYDSDVKNERTFSGFGQYNNGLEARSSGVELQASYQVTDTVSVDGNYTYTDSHTKAYLTDPDTQEKYLKWQRTVQVARNKANLGLNYDSGDYNVGLNAYYSGPRLRWKGDIEMKEYVRFDLSGRYRFNNGIEVSARIENLFDESIEEGLGYEEPGFYAVAGLDYNF